MKETFVQSKFPTGIVFCNILSKSGKTSQNAVMPKFNIEKQLLILQWFFFEIVEAILMKFIVIPTLINLRSNINQLCRPFLVSYHVQSFKFI